MMMDMGTATPNAPSSYREEEMQRLFIDFQTARLNELYYGHRAARFRRAVLTLNIITALSASSALAVLLQQFPGWLFLSLSIVAAVAAAVAPFLNFDVRASQFERAGFGHSTLRTRIEAILRDLRRSEINENHRGRIREIEEFRAALSPLDEHPGKSRILNRLWSQVQAEFPADLAWDRF